MRPSAKCSIGSEEVQRKVIEAHAQSNLEMAAQNPEVYREGNHYAFDIKDSILADRLAKNLRKVRGFRVEVSDITELLRH